MPAGPLAQRAGVAVTGAAFALAAGLMWGLVFVTPLLLPDYPAALLSVGRYVAFGLIALPLAAIDRRRLRGLSRADWLEALKLAAVGNLLYYLLLASAIQRAGAPVPTMIIGTLPVVIAIVSNLRDAHRDGRLPWVRLVPSLLLIGAGIGLVNKAELDAMRGAPAGFGLARHAIGAALAVAAAGCWTWYPLRNADWLRAHPDRSPRTWATAQGVATLPLALAGYAVVWALLPAQYAPPLGPRPGTFVVAMATIGLLASWLGTLCWNEASQRLPAATAGQLIVFETLAALAYAFILRGSMPGPLTLAGIALLIVGVMWAMQVKPEPLAEAGHSA